MNETAVIDLLKAAGFSGNPAIESLQGGANNRVYKVRTGSRLLLLKEYFQHPLNQRDRLNAEFNFSSYAFSSGLRCVPEPLALDSGSRIALYQFIEGRKLLPYEVNAGHITQAVAFYMELNRNRGSGEALNLPLAAEACFSLSAHLSCVEKRLQQLTQLERAGGLTGDFSEFVNRELTPAWIGVKTTALAKMTSLGYNPDQEIQPEDRRLSPSDFGFHNSLLTRSGRLVFLDFEYAGWDDPAKLVCDFFCQPEIPVSHSYFSGFSHELAYDTGNPGFQWQRMMVLLPVYQVKWCCILLNDFLPDGFERRRFAHYSSDDIPTKEETRRNQLLKARRMLRSIFDEGMNNKKTPGISQIFKHGKNGQQLYKTCGVQT